jgi:hypothetical protein
LSSRVDLDETVEIPQAIRGRVLFGGSPRKISDGMGGVRREGLTTKERIAAHRPTPPPPSRQKHKTKSTESRGVGNRRISHFFARIPSESNFSDEITIDD